MTLNILYIYILVMNILVTEMLPKMNHEVCLENDDKIINFIVGKSLKNCIQECVARSSCLSLNYRRLHKLCELFAVASGTFVTNNGRTGPCVHILRSDIKESKYNLQTCSKVDGTCAAKECPTLDFPHGVFTGNMREIGSRLLIKCESYLYVEETGRTSIKCQTNGTWDYQPNCTSAYMGCYEDDSARQLLNENKILGDNTMTIEKCIQHCFEYNYAGAQNGKQCFCGYKLDPDLTKPEGECNRKCIGNSSQTCGGTWRGSVYRLK